MALYRELAEAHNNGESWQSFWEKHYGSIGIIPDGLCLADWNSSLFGGLDAKGQMATFSRIRYFDAFSIEDTADCVGSADNEEMGIGNQVYEDLVADKTGKSRTRGSETYHLYEYVKSGTRFPFMTLILITGAIWAHEAWGRYWGWDPKETTALVTWLIYAAYIHARRTRGWAGRKAAAISVLGFFSVLFTYLGANLVLSGLHSYGGQ